MNMLALIEQKIELEKDPCVMEAMKAISTITQAKILVIRNDDQELSYNEMLLQAKGINRNLEQRRKEVVDPYNKLTKAVNGFFASLTDPIAAKCSEIETSIKRWRIHKAEESRKAQEMADRQTAKIQAKMEKQGITAPPPAMIVPKPLAIIRTAGGITYEKREWKVKEIADLKALAQAVADGRVIMDVIKPDIAALNRLVKAGIREIPGVVIHEEISIQTRSQ